MAVAPGTSFSVPRSSKPKASIGSASSLFLVGCLALIWGITNVAEGAASDSFLDFETDLLKFKMFSRANSVAMLDRASAQGLSACDIDAQRALLLLEIPLADGALQSGASEEFGRRTRSLELRARQALACAPRDSLVWLILFGLEIEHGDLSKHTFELLKMSYDTSPNEAWLSMRRITVAIPVVLAAPELLQRMIFSEFQGLIKNRMVEIPARIFSNAHAPIQALLRSRILELDPRYQRLFYDALAALPHT